MTKIVILSGSPFAPSKVDFLLTYIGNELAKKGLSIQHVSVRDLPAEDLIYARFQSLAIQNMIQIIQEADGIIIGSPVYKASYSGALKTVLDILPEDAFKEIPVLPLLIGGSMAHLLALDYSFKMIISHLKGHSCQGVYITSDHIDIAEPLHPINDHELQYRLELQIQELLANIERRQQNLSNQRQYM